MRSVHQRFGLGSFVFVAACLACVALPASGQFYTFTSGVDGFVWPASPTGLLDGDSYSTPDGNEFHNFTGNNVFFDGQYQVAGNSTVISGDALWGNPLDDDFSTLEATFFGTSVQSIEFDYAHAASGSPAATPDFIDIEIGDSEGRFTFESFFLDDSFPGFGGVDGRAGHVFFDLPNLFDITGDFEGNEQFVDIEYFAIELQGSTGGGPSAEFAIDNFSLDDSGGGGGPEEVYPSVNQGEFDVTGAILGGSTLRGTGTFGKGIEVTNGSATSATYSTELVPGGALTSGIHPNGAVINAGESIFTPDVASIDRSLPTGSYDSDIRIINDGDPSDPDNVSTFSIDLFDPQSLSGNFANVNVLASEQIALTNAAAAPAGFRASVEVTGSQTTGPFEVTNFAVDTAVKPGETAQTAVAFNRYGQLSGTRSGTHSVSLHQTAFFTGSSNDFEIFLANSEPVPDQVWNLSYSHVDATSDNANISTGFSYFQILGVNTFDVAATLIDGTSSKNQNVSMQITTNPDPASADLIGEPVDLTFGGGAGDPYVLQLTYNEGALPSGVTESQLQVLVFDTLAGDWEAAVENNTTGGSTFFSGSYDDYLAGLGGGVFDASDLGVFGVDTLNNHAWAILDHASIFGVGVLAGGVLADFDADGDVDAADFIAWQRGESPNPLSPADLALWQNQYGSGSALLATGTSVPEPDSAWLFLIVVALMAIKAPARSSQR